MKLDTNKPYRMLVCGQLLQEVNRRQGGNSDRISPQLVKIVEDAVNPIVSGNDAGPSPARAHSEFRAEWLGMLDRIGRELIEFEKFFFSPVPRKFHQRAIHNCFRKAIIQYNDALSNHRKARLSLYRDADTGSVIAAYNKPCAIYYGSTVAKATKWQEVLSTADIEEICARALDNPHVAFQPFGTTYIACATKMTPLRGLDY